MVGQWDILMKGNLDWITTITIFKARDAYGNSVQPFESS